MKKRLLVLFCAIALSYQVNSQTSSNEETARNWIKNNSKELGIKESDQFKLSFVRKSISGETLRFQQMINDVPVYQSQIVVHFNPSNEISFSSNSYDKTLIAVSTTPSISKEDAILKSNESLKITTNFSYQECKLVVAKVNDSFKLVYKIITNPNSGAASWEVLVDAQTGNVLAVKDVAINHHKKENLITRKKNKIPYATPNSFVTGTAMVYDPDPLSKAHVAYAGQYIDGDDSTNASLDAARTSVVLPQIDLTSGVYKLKSQYVNIADFETPNKGLFTQTTGSDFNFTRDNDAFEAVNAFYHLDKSMRYINETLGVTCTPSLNGGVFNFDPSGLDGDDNSHYIPSTEQIAFGEGCVDDAEDADVVLHEFGHGIHDWVTGGNSSSLTGLGEGSGDYWAMSYSRSLNQWASTEPAYNWVFSWDGHDECWSGRTTNYTRTYPQTSATYTQIHTYGQTWATALMKIYDVIGRQKTDKAFLEGLALTGSTTNQPQAALAVRQAAINMNYPCADIQTMTTKFNAAGYALPALPLSMAAIADQTVTAAVGNTYTLPSYATLANPITANCDATVTQSPIVGTILAPGTYTITMTATSGAATVTRTFNLTILPNLSTNQNQKNIVKIYPNPATNEIIIKGFEPLNDTISVYNILGQKIMETEINSNEVKLSISHLSNGVYTIKFNTSKASYKFIKE